MTKQAQNILLIHGALGSSKIFDELKIHLSHKNNVYCIDLLGYGVYSEEKDVNVTKLCSQIIDYIEMNNLQGINVFGYSMGGYLSLMIALQRPDIFNQIITLGTKFEWSESIANKEAQLVTSFMQLPNEHPFIKLQFGLHGETAFQNCIHVTCNLISEIGKNSYLTNEKLLHLNIPVLLLIGEQDIMVTQNETQAIFKALPNAKLLVLPETKHPLDKVNKLMLANLIENRLADQ
ncbi:MAG TPA: alpha/beta fold hydrolase [Bacteroidia bacterium]|nr:alpha/beta fold hydrolase [Bacteroidia bacterium]